MVDMKRCEIALIMSTLFVLWLCLLPVSPHFHSLSDPMYRHIFVVFGYWVIYPCCVDNRSFERQYTREKVGCMYICLYYLYDICNIQHWTCITTFPFSCLVLILTNSG